MIDKLKARAIYLTHIVPPSANAPEPGLVIEKDGRCQEWHYMMLYAVSPCSTGSPTMLYFGIGLLARHFSRAVFGPG